MCRDTRKRPCGRRCLSQMLRPQVSVSDVLSSLWSQYLGPLPFLIHRKVKKKKKKRKESFPMLLSTPLARAVPGTPSPHVTLLSTSWNNSGLLHLTQLPKGRSLGGPLLDFFFLDHLDTFLYTLHPVSVCLSLWQASHEAISEGWKEVKNAVSVRTPWSWGKDSSQQAPCKFARGNVGIGTVFGVEGDHGLI